MQALRRTLIVVAAVVGMSVGLGGTALAAPNPNGTGLPASGGNPDITCQNIAAANPGIVVTPGHSADNGGSPYSPTGTGGAHYAAISEYDIACYQRSVNH
jgi:hypothetical protein